MIYKNAKGRLFSTEDIENLSIEYMQPKEVKK